MRQSRRKNRPLDREQQVYRDDRLYIVACDDRYAPKQYFDGFKSDFMGARLQVYVDETTDGASSAEHVLARLLKHEVEEGDQRWLLLDTDHYINDSHRASFLKAITQARQSGVLVALSKPCFEFWFLLHHLDHEDQRLDNISNAKEVDALLSGVLGQYNKGNVDINKFPLEIVPKAVAGARERDASVDGGDVPNMNTSRVYQLWEEIIRNASLPQLPKALRPLKASIG